MVRKKPLGHRDAQAARRRRNAHVRTVRRAAQRRRQADVAGGHSPRPMRDADVLVPTVTDRIDAAADRAGRRTDEAHRQFRQRRRQHRRERALRRGITVTNTPGVLTEDTADMTMALILAVARRIVEGAQVIPAANGPAGRRPGCSAAASPASGSASSAWAASARRSRAAPRPSACRFTITTAAAFAAAIEEALEATYWESLDQMLARMDIVSVNCPHTPATYHLLSARRLKLLRPRRDRHQHGARRDHRRERR